MAVGALLARVRSSRRQIWKGETDVEVARDEEAGAVEQKRAPAVTENYLSLVLDPHDVAEVVNALVDDEELQHEVHKEDDVEGSVGQEPRVYPTIDAEACLDEARLEGAEETRVDER